MVSFFSMFLDFSPLFGYLLTMESCEKLSFLGGICLHMGYSKITHVVVVV